MKRTFDLRPAPPRFSQLSQLKTHGICADHDIVECSALHYLIEQLKHNPIESFSLVYSKRFDSLRSKMKALQTCFLKSLPVWRPDARDVDEQVGEILHRKTRPDAQSDADFLYSPYKRFIEPDGRQRFFLALEAALSPDDRAILACYNQDIYEEPVVHRFTRKTKAEQ